MPHQGSLCFSVGEPVGHVDKQIDKHRFICYHIDKYQCEVISHDPRAGHGLGVQGSER